MMAAAMRPIVVACVVSLASAQYNCPASWKKKGTTAKCAGPASTDCSDASCCNAPKTCNHYSGAWVLAQVGGGGCRKNSKKMFFDLKKLSAVVADDSEATITSACCTSFTAAKCSDWNMMVCKEGTTRDTAKAGNDAGVDGLVITRTAFSDKCCKTIPTPPDNVCSKWAALWIPAVTLGGGCRKDGAKKFWDLKKSAATVAEPKGEAEVAAACCTATSAAVCSDWSTVKSCKTGSGYRLDSAKSNVGAPANKGDFDIEADSFNSKCCSIPPTTCAAKFLSFGNVGCQKDGTNYFFDTKKSAVATANTDSEVKKNCCTPVADALCSDWSASFTCPSGKYIFAAKKVGGKAKLGKPDNLQANCCGAPLLCSAWTPSTNADSAYSSGLSLLALGALAMGLIRG